MSLESIRFAPVLLPTNAAQSTAAERRVLIGIAAANSAPASATAGVKWADTSDPSAAGTGAPLCDIEVLATAVAGTVVTWRPWTRSANSGGWHAGATRTLTVPAALASWRDSIQFAVIARDRVFVELLTASAAVVFDAWVNTQHSNAAA